MSKDYRIALSSTSIDDLVELKRKGVTVRKVSSGITPERYGHVYSAGGYTLICGVDPEEIRKALSKVKKGEAL